MRKRRAKFEVALTYSSPPEDLQKLSQDIWKVLKHDKDIEPDTCYVRFSDLADYSLNLTVVFYSTLPKFADFLTVKERVNYAILNLVSESGANFAYPTSLVYVEPDAKEEEE